MIEVYKYWKCTSKTCSNHSFHCFVDKADGKHYHLNANDIARCAKAINSQKATLDRPSDRLRGVLMRREARSTSSTNITNASTPMQGNVLNHFNFNASDLFAIMRHIQNPGSNSPSSISAKKQSAIPNSSPIESDDDYKSEVTQYFEFLMKKYKKHDDTIQQFKKAQELAEKSPSISKVSKKLIWIFG